MDSEDDNREEEEKKPECDFVQITVTLTRKLHYIEGQSRPHMQTEMKVYEKASMQPLHEGKMTLSYTYTNPDGVLTTTDVTRTTMRRRVSQSNNGPEMPQNIPHRSLYKSNIKVLNSEPAVKQRKFT